MEPFGYKLPPGRGIVALLWGAWGACGDGGRGRDTLRGSVKCLEVGGPQHRPACRGIGFAGEEVTESNIIYIMSEL